MGDPDRLAGEESDLGRLLVAANADMLEDERVARVQEGLVTAGAFTAGVALHKLTALKVAKVLAGVLLAGGGGATAYLLLRSPAAPQPTATLQVPATPSIQPAPLATPSVGPVTTLQVEDLPESSAAPQKRSASTIKPAASASVSAAIVPPSPREGLLLLQARQSMARDPQRALDLVRQHEQEFPASQLQPERTQLETEAIAAGAK